MESFHIVNTLYAIAQVDPEATEAEIDILRRASWSEDKARLCGRAAVAIATTSIRERAGLVLTLRLPDCTTVDVPALAIAVPGGQPVAASASAAVPRLPPPLPTVAVATVGVAAAAAAVAAEEDEEEDDDAADETFVMLDAVPQTHH
jgi:hypothetical protein